ncbi:hypothetical protein KUTeg_012893 [Tegillarca granosa]|uniref:Ubiquinone biosynthesis monooxygenase COQ6, mitochondrial n=1 Tax=Tegillarca granosa TaxID=220873 RepID=A0ABQ9ES20_TEGGR|nr:hypothetical protein KUTeg_012893 [Tegillarca granosa]
MSLGKQCFTLTKEEKLRKLVRETIHRPPAKQGVNMLRRCALCFSTGKHLKLSYSVVRRLQTNSVKNEETADIVISGGGMVGAAMACALDKFGIRTCTVSPSSIDLFKSVGAWDEILQMRCHPVKRMQVWESCSDALITFNDENLVDDIAYVVENDVIQEALRRQLSKLSERVDVRYSTSASSFIIPGVTPGYDNINQNSWVTVNTTDDKTIKTKLLVGADGAQSPVRKAGGFHTVGWNYKQTAVVATLKLSEVTENNVAWQRFLPTGPIAMLPLSDQHSNLIWTTTPEFAKHLKEIPEDSFVDAVNDALVSQIIADVSSNSIRQLPPTIGGVEAKSRASFPLALLHSSNYAHRIHPLAGQGINLGFGDVKELKDVLVEAVSFGSDPGSLSHLTKYESSRQRKVLPVAATIDGLQKLYGTDFTPVVLLRTLGLQATNALSFIKVHLDTMKGEDAHNIQIQSQSIPQPPKS